MPVKVSPHMTVLEAARLREREKHERALALHRCMEREEAALVLLFKPKLKAARVAA